MKTWLYILTTLLVFAVLSGVNDTKKVPDDIIEALKTGNSKELSYFFNQSINLTILDKSGLYNKKQAEIILNDFFKTNQIKNFLVVQQKEQQNFSSLICNMYNQNNILFIIYLSVYQINDKQLITQLKISYPK